MTYTKLRYNFQFYNSMQTKQCSHVGRRPFPCNATHLRYTNLLLNQTLEGTALYVGLLLVFFFTQKNTILIFFHLRRLVYNPSSSVHLVSEFKGGALSVTNGQREDTNPCVQYWI